MNTLVSIIIPLYNAEEYIAETIESVINQSWINKEILIIDDGSTDKSYEIAKYYECEILKIYRLKKAGACRARNYGFEVSSGAYVQYLDADDLLSKNLIEEKMKLFLQNDEKTVIISKLKLFERNIQHSKYLSKDLYKNYNKGIDLIEDMAIKWQPLQVSAWMIPRKLQLKAGMWDETLLRNQDGEMLIRLLLHSKKVLFCDNTESYYRHNLSSLSNQSSNLSFQSLYNSYLKYERNLFNYEYSTRTQRIMTFYYSNLIYLTYINFPHISRLAQIKIKSFNLHPVYGGNYLVYLISKIVGLTTIIHLFNMIKKIVK